ncbi:MAG: hypothetical protein EBY29_12505, partial [Planctomycetes bacterium]|nr:hypothetical protein [Planctomycetota bacterium]
MTVTNTFDLNGQRFYSHGSNGFSVNENFDAGNATTTAYHYTSGDSARNIMFSIAKTSDYTNMFATYGSASDNTFVFGAEAANNTAFEFRSGLGIGETLNLSGGTLLYKVAKDGQVYAPGLQDASGSNILYYDISEGLITYGSAQGGGAGE